MTSARPARAADRRGLARPATARPATARPAPARPAPARATLAEASRVRGLHRPLAPDAVRAQFWVRHLRIGVGLSMATAALLGLYALAADRPHPTAVAAFAGAAFVLSPLLLRLPMERMAQDHRGRPFFYAWSVVVVLVVTAAAWTDGGGSSFLVLLLGLTLSYAVAYPPRGVAVLGGLMVASCAAVSVTGPAVPLAQTAVPAGVLCVFVVMATWTSHNQWEAHAQQDLLARSLEIEATTDALTGCLNRRAFMQRLVAATRPGADAGTGPGIAVCLIDLDGFKQVNDTRGHAAGDVVLRAVAEALRGAVRESDTVARLGGDEFVVLTTAPPPPEELAHRLRAAVAREGRAHGVTASVGVAVGTAADGAETLLLRADGAMYRAKTAGGDRVA